MVPLSPPKGGGWAALLCLLALLGASPAAAQDWPAFKQAFVSGDGRVIDRFNHSVSHSEGQGYGLLLALFHEDRPAFERLWRWTTANLQVRRDALFAWSWGKRPNGEWAVIDYNNASDGDILIALALLEAASRWNHPPFKASALRIVGDIRTQLAVTQDGLRLISPGYFGFASGAGLVVNPGYLVLPAFSRFAQVDDRDFWDRVAGDSATLLDLGAFSRFRLPADWILLQGGRASVHTEKSPYFGYEAIRVPLYLLWGGQTGRLSAYAPYLEFVERAGYLPGRVDLIGGFVSSEEAPAGFYALMAACSRRLGMEALAHTLEQAASAKIGREPDDYFSHALFLLCRFRLDGP
ncbi:MAG: glycosyl hydrolase family 8 [Desulfobacterales bacterium]